MDEQSVFRKSIFELKSFQKDYFISLKDIENWLHKHSRLFNQSLNNYSCSIHKPKLPCFCCKRRTDCLFIDIYYELDKQKQIIKKEEIYGNYVAEYNLLKSNEIDLKNWFNEYKQFYLTS